MTAKKSREFRNEFKGMTFNEKNSLGFDFNTFLAIQITSNLFLCMFFVKRLRFKSILFVGGPEIDRPTTQLVDIQESRQLQIDLP